MTFIIYWKRLQDKNNGLLDNENKMTISVSNFKKALEQAYDIGRQDEKAVKTAVDTGGFGDLFGSIFGGAKK